MDNACAAGGYSGDYEYDLVGNRLGRTVVAGGEMLSTVYEYNDNDQLVREENTVQLVAIPTTGPILAGTSATGFGLLGGTGMKSQPSGRTYRDLPSLFSFLAFWSVPVLILLISTLCPLCLCVRYKHRIPVLYRTVSAVLALIFLIGFEPFDLLAQEAQLYSQLKASNWGRHGSITNYEYDLNGSMVRKLTTEDARSVDEVFQYNLENRLATHIKTTDVTASDELTIATTTYLYNHEGIKVRKATEIVAENKATHEQTIVSTSSESYLIDAYNHTGYAQVLESVTDTGAVTSYTIGDDVLLQSTRHSLGDGGPITFDNQYFLPDGHGSTRQLTDSAGTITAQYSYDSYGLMLGQHAGSQQEQATKLLYCGEQFDASLQMYNLRARHYDPSNGRFNRLDPFSGSQYDPQSLHKYAYCHSDPVNNVDPSGMRTLLEQMMVGAIISMLAQIVSISIRVFTGDVGSEWEEVKGMVGAAAWGAIAGGVSWSVGFIFKSLNWSKYFVHWASKAIQGGSTSLVVSMIKILYDHWVLKKPIFTGRNAGIVFFATIIGVFASGIVGWHTSAPIVDSSPGSLSGLPDGTWTVVHKGVFSLSPDFLDRSARTISGTAAVHLGDAASLAKNLLMKWIREALE